MASIQCNVSSPGGPQTFCIWIDDYWRDLDRFVHYCNLERRQHDHRAKGRAPAHAFMEALGVDKAPEIIPIEEIIEPLPTAA